MKAIKRTIAGLLATLMFVTCFNFNFAFGAEEYTKEEEIVVSKANAANVMTGTDNGFEPTKTLTRAEAAAIVVRMKGISDTQVASAKGDTLFSDVASDFWATGYINAASSMGIISGVGGGLFQPSREVTVIEFTAMATRALGAGKLVDSLGTWPTNYVNFASEEGLTDGVMRVYTAPATRMDAAFIAVNTLEADVWEKEQVTNTSEVTYAKREDKTLLSESLKITVAENAKIESIDMKERTATFSAITAGDEQAEKAEGWGNFDIVSAVELATLKPGMEVDVWAKEKAKEIVRIAPAEVSKQNEIKFSGIEKIEADAAGTSGKITLLVNGEEKKYTIDYEGAGDNKSNTLVSLNTNAAPVRFTVVADNELTVAALATGANTDTVIEKATGYDDYFGTAILDGNKVTTIYAERYLNKKVVKEIKNETLYFESNSDVKFTTPNYSSIDMDDDDLEFVVTKAGKEIKVTDIEEGDALYFYVDKQPSDDRYVIVVNNNTVEGTVTNVAKDSYVKMDGKKYELSETLKIANSEVSVAAGDEVKLYLNGRNEITMYEMIEGSVDSTVAMVKSLRAITDNYGKQKLEIVLVKLDGTELETKEVDLEETAKKLKDMDPTVADFDTEIEVVRGIYNNTAKTTDFNWDTDLASAADGVDATADTLTFAESIVGEMIRYTLKGGDVVIREFLGATIVSSYDDEKIETASVTYKEDNSKFSNGYRLNSNSVIYTVKKYANAEAKSKYSCKLEKIAFEDLGDLDVAADVFFVGVDEDTNIVDAVLFTEEPGRSTENNYAVVLDRSEINDDDYSVEYELLLADGTVVEVKVEEDSDVDDDMTNGTIVEAFITDGVLVDTNAVVALDDLTDNAYVYSFNSDGTIKVLDDSDAKKVYTISDKCMFVKIDEDDNTDYSKGKEGDIKTISTTLEDYSAVATADTKADIAKLMFAKNTDTEEDEIIAIFYED